MKRTQTRLFCLFSKLFNRSVSPLCFSSLFLRSVSPLSFFFHFFCFSALLLSSSCSKDTILNPNTVTTYQVYYPYDMVLDNSGNMYITNVGDYDIIKVNTAGSIKTYAGAFNDQGYAGDGGSALSARLDKISGIAIDKAGNIYFCDDNHIRCVSTTGTINSVAGNMAGSYSGDGGPATAATLNYPVGVATDTAGNVYIADFINCRVRKITTKTGIITSIAGNGTGGYSGDGGLATAAEINGPNGIAVDDSGNVYVGDFNNFVVRKIYATTGMIATIAGNHTQAYTTDGNPATATGLYPNGIALDSLSNLYIADSHNYRVYEVNAKTNIINTVAGSGKSGNKGDSVMATAALINIPTGVAIGKGGNIFIVDQGADCIREVNVKTHIITQVVHN